MAIHIQSDSISLAHVVCPPGEKPSIRFLESFATNGDAPAAIRLLAKKYTLSDYRCLSLMGDKEYRILQTDAPEVPTEEQIAALRWQLKDAVDFPLNDAAIDIAPIPSEQQGRKNLIFALAAPRTAVATLMGQFNDAKIKLQAIDVPEMALRNISSLLATENRGHALLHIGPVCTQFIVTHEGHLILCRRIDLSASQLAAATEDRQTALIERMGLELQRTLDTFERQFASVSISSMAISCAEEVSTLASRIKESFYIPIEQLDLDQIIDISAIPELRNPVWQARNLQLIGGCLRNCDG